MYNSCLKVGGHSTQTQFAALAKLIVRLIILRGLCELTRNYQCAAQRAGRCSQGPHRMVLRRLISAVTIDGLGEVDRHVA